MSYWRETQLMHLEDFLRRYYSVCLIWYKIPSSCAQFVIHLESNPCWILCKIKLICWRGFRWSRIKKYFVKIRQNKWESAYRLTGNLGETSRINEMCYEADCRTMLLQTFWNFWADMHLKYIKSCTLLGFETLKIIIEEEALRPKWIFENIMLKWCF